MARGKHQSADCGRTRRSRAAGRGDRGAARRRRHRAVRRALPQGSDRRARRCAIAHAGRAAELPARAGGAAQRRSSNSIREQGKLDAALEAAILAADSKGRLEDIYLPFKPKRRTKAEIAREAGLEPLAESAARAARERSAGRWPPPFVDADKQVADVAAALDGARAILVERFAEDADLIGALREQMWATACMTSTVRKGKKTEGEKFKDYFDFSEPLTKLPSHRILAMFRGEKEEILDLQMLPEAAERRRRRPELRTSCKIMQRFAISDRGRPGDKWMTETVRWAWRTKIQVHLNIDLRMRLWTAAEEEAVRVFASNLRDLLLAAPAGARVTMGLDPGYRSGVKVAVVDATGKVVATDTIYPHEPQRRWDEALAMLGKLAAAASRRPDRDRQRHRVARDRQARDRAGQAAAGPEDVEDRGVGSRRLGLFGLGLRVARNCRISTSRCAARCRSRGGCRIRWPNWSRSIRRRSASGSTSMTSARASWRARSMRWSRTASTRSASTPTPPRRRCWRGCRASAPGSRRASSSTATPTVRSSRARR